MSGRTPALLLSALFLLSVLSACSNNVAQNPGPSSAAFTDSAGRIVELPKNITKISPSGPLSQMFLLAIAPDLLVTLSSDYPEEFHQFVPDYIPDLPVVGQFYGSADLNVESIAAIGTELVIDIGEPKNTVVEDMDSITQALAIPAIHISATLTSAPEAFRTLGNLLNRTERGEALAQYCEKVLLQIDSIMSDVGDDKVSIIYCLGDSGLNVLAKGSYHAEILDYIADNAAVVDDPSSRGSGNEIDMEQLFLWDPDVILFAPDSVYSSVGYDDVWLQLSAVQNLEYYEVPNGPYNWLGTPPSINRYLGMLWLTKTLYPDFIDFDLYDAVSEYYKLFYHFDMTPRIYSNLLKNS